MLTLLPMCKKSSAEIADPTLAKLLTERELPRVVQSKRDILAPSRSMAPATLQEEPILPKFLTDKLLPTWKKSMTETAPPRRAKFRIDIDEPT
jgi:hypothetical protein